MLLEQWRQRAVRVMVEGAALFSSSVTHQTPQLPELHLCQGCLAGHTPGTLILFQHKHPRRHVPLSPSFTEGRSHLQRGVLPAQGHRAGPNSLLAQRSLINWLWQTKGGVHFYPSGFMHRAPGWPLAMELRARRRGPPQSCWLPSDPRPSGASLLQNRKQGGHPRALGTMATTGPGSATGGKGQSWALESPTSGAPGSPLSLWLLSLPVCTSFPKPGWAR